MAKSIRSKSGRKNRAVKRVRYAKKELIRLKKTLGLPVDPAEETVVHPNQHVITYGDFDDEKHADYEFDVGGPKTFTKYGLNMKEMRHIAKMVRADSDREDSDAERELEKVVAMVSQSRKTKKVRDSYLKKDEVESKMSGNVEMPLVARESSENRQRKGKPPAVYNPITLRDKGGNYPIWINQKKRKKLYIEARKHEKIRRKIKKETNRRKCLEDRTRKRKRGKKNYAESDNEEEKKGTAMEVAE